MDITPQGNTTQPISDDQELAKALAGVMPDAPAPQATTTPALDYEETPAPAASTPAVTEEALPDVPEAPEPAETTEEETPQIQKHASSHDDNNDDSKESSDLEDIRKDALQELRPLMDKVDLPAEEKFNTYLMLIRSTDDRTLIAPAHEAAQAIEDEKIRAEALLNIIKEIDYLSQETLPSAE